ncbi:hypothetical protein [Methylomonas methanica]|uniref:Uncharacterized protein n=1 Tax=Methylomonas methanica (strain DSM 25384 / MC09) TaxID=857087 RepID=F9ZVC1_METMM|nr:hypothetical protein [Methylomonas methanica]AEG00731.1 hypothetical protein Metme_2329 [Methylomonas methanica MC09]
MARKSSFYKARWNRCGLNETRAAEIIGCTVEDVQRFDDEGAPIAERLLLLWDSKHVNHDGWDGFLFSRGILRYKNRRWTPCMLKAIHNEREELDALRREISRLKTWRGLFTFSVYKAVNCVRHHKARRGLKID